MAIGTSAVQLTAPGNASFTVDSISDPNGAPGNVLDVDLGFEVTGSVTMPNFLTGKGTVCLYADELGGPFDDKIGCTDVEFKPTKGEPPDSQTLAWTISYPPTGAGPLLDPSTGSQLYRLAAIFVFGDQSLDIAAFVELGTFLIN